MCRPLSCCPLWSVWRCQRGNANPNQRTHRQHNGQIRKGQTMIHKTLHIKPKIDRVRRTPLKAGCKLRCSGRLISSCSTSGTRRVTLVTTRWWAMNEERTGKSLPQVEYIQSQLWHRCSVTVNQNNISCDTDVRSG